MRNNLLLGAAVAALVIPGAAFAQETTTTIRGTVVSNGAPVAGATVVAVNVPSGTRSETTTDANGTFTLNGLRTGGPFTVEVTAAEGTTSITDIYTVVGQPYDLPVDLAANTTADIVVTASSIAGAGVTSDGPQTVLTQSDIRKVASVNRDIRDLARRDPLATLDLSNGTGAVSFGGVNPRFNRFTINGVQVGDNFGLNQDANPTARGPVPFDAIAQFSVSIAPYDIRQGNFQGGAIDTVLLSGTNTFHGTGFYSQSRDELQGDRIGSNTINLPDYNSETYGATLSGPLIKDKLFFMVSAERNTDPRPFTPSAINQIPGLTEATVANVQQIAQNVYGYDTGDVLSVNNQKDEKIVGRIDWNIVDGQRLSLSYINAYESSDILQNTSQSTSTPSLGLASNAYSRSVLLRAGIVQLNSDWTDRLSTEARFLYKSNRVGQDPYQGRGFAQFRVCTDALSTGSTTGCSTGVPVVAFGPDISRQANELFFDTWGGSLSARYQAGSHSIRLLAEVNVNRSYNLFQQNVSGHFYFDSIADFQARNASGANFAVPVNGDINSVASNFKYTQFTFGAEDVWNVTDTLEVTAGYRYDLYAMRDAPIYNPFFQARTGFRNTVTYKGLDNFQPRLSFNWKPDPLLRVRGGVGIFGGGSPDIYLSNSFSNTGVVANAFATSSNLGVIRATSAGTATATCNAPFTGANAAVCTDLLNGVTGTSLPASAQNYLTVNTAGLATSPTAALAPDLDLPSVLRATLSADYRLFGFDVGADFVYSNTLSAPTFYDARSIVIGTLPDGRPRYNAATLYNGQIATTGIGGDTNSDIIFANNSRGRSYLGTVRFQKEFDFGLSFGGSYSLQDVRDVSPATSSTATSLYANAAMVDPNSPAYGTSNDQTSWAFKYNIGFDRAFFGDYRTVIQLFGETRAGRPYSFTMQNNVGGRSPVFGTIGNNDRYLLYVPASASDPLVSYDSQATQDALEDLISRTALRDYRGRIAAKNIARSRAFTRIDLHVEQEIPTFIGRSRITLFGDIENLPNLLDSDWGGLRQLGFPYTGAVVQVSCLNAPVATGTAPGTGVTNTAPTQACAQYRYSQYREPNTAAVRTSNSLFLIRLGARFTF